MSQAISPEIMAAAVAQAAATARPLEEHLALVKERKRRARIRARDVAYDRMRAAAGFKRKRKPPTPEQQMRYNQYKKEVRARAKKAQMSAQPVVMNYKTA